MCGWIAQKEKTTTGNDCLEEPTSYIFGVDNDFRFIDPEGCTTD